MEHVNTSTVCYSYFRLMVGGDGMEPGDGILHMRQVRVYG